MRCVRTKHLLERRAADDLPDLLQVLGQAYVPALSGLDRTVAAEDLECGPDAGEHEICASDAFVLQPLHPVAHACGQFAQDIRPVADGRFQGSWTADQVDTGSKRGRVPSTQT